MRCLRLSPILGGSILITSAPQIDNITSATSFCEGIVPNEIPFSATVQNGTVLWSVENGSGTITNNSDPNNAFYTPSAQDFQNGSVQIKLSVTGSAPCNNVVSQTFTIAMFQELTVNAGPNRLFCENDPNFIVSSEPS